ncbi:MAG: amino acid adenylation domain-containing protein, partial [Arenicellales bacterium]
ALKILVARYSQQQDVVIGIPIANRTRSELENLIGFFVNTLALRTNLADDPTFENLIHEIRDETLQAYSHQDLPFEKLVEETHPERDLSRNPIYQVFFAFQNLPQLREEFADLSMERLPQKRTTVMTDLDIYAWEESGCLRGTFVYNKALFKPPTIKRMIGHFRTILEEIVADSSRRISQIQILTEKERTQLLSEWNSTRASFSEDCTIGKLFEDQVIKTPDAVALEFGDQTLSFSELNARANQLAHYLRSSGVVAESPVGVYLDRSMEQVIAILGVIKAGGAYVPLDPDYPAGRIQFMLQDSGCQVLVTQSDLHTVCSDYEGKIVTLDEGWADIGVESNDNLGSITTPESAAYIIYTSGSTGMPKGVVGLHRGAVNRMNWMWRNYPFSDEEVCCLKTRISFVDSIWELFGPLLQGVRVLLIPDEVVQDPERLVETLSSSRVSRLVLVPSLLRVLLQNVADLRTRLPDLKLWITSGESLPIELFHEFHKIIPHSRLLNLYGSSEVSADVTACELTLDNARDRVSIGKPIDNTKIYILDRDLNPMPVGVPGELYVSGVGLARGYLNRPDLTSERFVHNPFDGEQESRLFRTGDLARYRNNGEIEYMGRGDTQIKLRGFRIELGEIEAILKALEGLESVVVAVKEKPNEQLVAFYSTKDSYSNLSQETIRDHARAMLPNYMVPVIYRKLDSLPLTASGKVDRIALFANENLEIETVSSELREPHDDVELQLLELWRGVLQTENISTDANFFDLGGHSLLAVELISKVNRVFEKVLPVVTLFESPTIEELARIIGAEEDPTVRKSLFCVRSGNDRETPFYFVHDVDGEAILYHELANSISQDRPVYVLRPYGTAECPILHSRIKDMAAHYIDEIKQIQPNGPYHVGGLCAGGVIAFEMACQLQDRGDDVPMVAILDALEITTKPSRRRWGQRFDRVSTSIHGKGL